MELYNGDYLEVMKNIPDKSVDCIITDPPYELSNHGGVGKTEFSNRKIVKMRS